MFLGLFQPLPVPHRELQKAVCSDVVLRAFVTFIIPAQAVIAAWCWLMRVHWCCSVLFFCTFEA